MTITLEDLLGDLEIDDPIFKTVRENIWNQEEFAKMMDNNPNFITLCNLVHFYGEVDNNSESRKSKAFLNLLKLLALEFKSDPFYNSRIGWYMWFIACYARYDSYFPMRWCFHYDPLNWYREGEPHRPAELEKTLPEDPFNIRGKCWVHPEWYLNIKEVEDGSVSDSAETDSTTDSVQE